MCAKLGELFQLAKRKTLTANIFLEGEAFSNLLLKEFLHGVGCRNSIKHRCDAPFIFHFIIEQLSRSLPRAKRRVALLYFLPVYSAIIERRYQLFVMNSEKRIFIISHSWSCEIKLINFNSCVSSTAQLSFFRLSVYLQT